MNENLPHRKQGVWFGVIDVCPLGEFQCIFTKCTPEINQTAHTAPHQVNF